MFPGVGASHFYSRFQSPGCRCKVIRADALHTRLPAAIARFPRRRPSGSSLPDAHLAVEHPPYLLFSPFQIINQSDASGACLLQPSSSMLACAAVPAGAATAARACLIQSPSPVLCLRSCICWSNCRPRCAFLVEPPLPPALACFSRHHWCLPALLCLLEQ